MENFDVIIIGSGPGGYVAAIRAAQLGMRTAIVEKMETLGGTCLNVGCIPSKALIDSSNKYKGLSKDFSEHGIEAKEISLNLGKLIARKNAVVKKLTSGVAGLIKGNKIHRFSGFGILRPGNTHTVDIYENPFPLWDRSQGGVDQYDDVSDEQLAKEGTPRESIHAPRVVLATGSVPTHLSSAPFDGKDIVGSTAAVSFSSLPKTMVVVGAGAIGLEMASVWASLGTKVTIVEKMGQVLPGWDSQLARIMHRELKQLGIECILNESLQEVKTLKSGLKVQLGDREVKTDKILVAVGRSANIQSAGILEAGIVLTEDKRHVVVNEDYQTSVAGVYAIGDLIPGPMLAHKAEDEAVVAVERMNGIPARMNYHNIPSVVYTAPEIASVGYSEDQLKRDKLEYKKGVFNIAGNGRALAMGLQSGFVKILTDPQTDKIRGAHIIAHDASDLISELVTVMEMKGSSEDIARIVHAHPTLSEAVKEAALAVHGRSLHSLVK